MQRRQRDLQAAMLSLQNGLGEEHPVDEARRLLLDFSGN
jgi:hypothetical protein